MWQSPSHSRGTTETPSTQQTTSHPSLDVLAVWPLGKGGYGGSSQKIGAVVNGGVSGDGGGSTLGTFKVFDDVGFLDRGACLCVCLCVCVCVFVCPRLLLSFSRLSLALFLARSVAVSRSLS